MRTALVLVALLAVAATSASAQLGAPQGSIGKSTPAAKAGAAPAKAPASLPPPPVAPKGPGQADLRIVKVEHKVVMQGCKANAPFAEVVATVKNKGIAPSAGLADPSAVAAVFKVDGQEKRFPAAGGLMPLPPDGAQVVVMKIPFHEGLFPVEKLPDGWTGRKSTTSYQIQVNAAGLIDENKAGGKGVLHDVQVTKEQCPELFHTLPPFDAFVQFQGFCQQSKEKVKMTCALAALGTGALQQALGAPAAQSSGVVLRDPKLPSLCNACKAACPDCFGGAK